MGMKLLCILHVLLLLAAVLPICRAWTPTPDHRLRPKVRTSITNLNLAPQQLGFFEALDFDREKTLERVVRLESYLSSSHFVPYDEGWQRQKDLWQAHADRLQNKNDNGSPSSSSSFGTNDGCDTIIMLQHEPVFTLGTASDESFIHGNTDASIPVQRINRGGEVTYHGPGQLTVYPVLDLRNYRQDIHWYIRALEEVVIRALAEVGVPDATRDDETTGVWVQNHKVAAVGVHARKWITQHGLAINVTPESLKPFTEIVPCGLHGRSVGCVQQFSSNTVSVDDMAEAVSVALEEVFCIELQ